ncbi:MAG TPA: cytochrome P450 [Candidatus Binatia bacterium]|jgi:cytochrome P450|nr:cytochrome P450 [Candidatus Binatia bacterium]
MRSLDDAPFLDIFSPEFQADPASAVSAARAQAPIARTAFGALVIERASVHALLADPRLDSSLLPIVRMQGLSDGPVYDLLARALLSVDGEDHTRLRKLVSRAFTPRSVEVLRPSMSALTTELVDGFAAGGRCEFMTAFADHYPIQMICELLGVPREDHERFGEWANGLTWLLSFELASRMPEIEAAYAGLMAYLDDFIEARRRAPEDDLVTRLIEAEDGGDHLSPLELRGMIGALLFAGYDTTKNQLGIAMSLFAQFPAQWRLLGDDPRLAAAAVEEVLRFQGTVAVAPRVARDEVTVGDFVVPAGTLLTLSTGAANHDPAAYDRPERFDITMTREPPLTFGGGAHYCLGANLARAEMQEALAILGPRLRDLALDGEPTWRPRTGIFGPTRLPLRFAGTAR